VMEKDDNSDKVCLSVKEKYTSEQPEEMVTNLKASVRELSVKVKEQNQRKCDAKDKLQQLRERISKEVVDVSVQELIPLLRSLKEFVKEESEVRSRCNVKRSALEDAVHDLEERAGKGLDGEIQEEDLDGLLVVSLDNLTSAKKVYSFYAIDSLYASSASCS